MATVSVDQNKCTGCGTCVEVCPVSIFQVIDDKAKIIEDNLPNCIECHACEMGCPVKAVHFKK